MTASTARDDHHPPLSPSSPAPVGAALSVRGLSKRYGPHWALGGEQGGLDLDLPRGGLTALLGPNGAGKSTLIGLLLGLEAPTRGQVQVLGADPRQPQARTRLGALPQELSLPSTLTVRELLSLYAALYPRPLSVDRVLELCDLTALARRRASALSGGQARRLGFGLSVIGDPELLFLDEPTTAMDVQSRQIFWAGVGAMQAQGKTIVLTTHYLEEAERVADRVVVLRQGQVIADGTPETIKAGVRGAAVSFRSRLSLAAIQAQPEVLEATINHGPETEWALATVRTREPERLLAALFASGAELRELQVSRASLEEAFLTLTAGDFGAAGSVSA